jgi:hypothetical protein
MSGASVLQSLLDMLRPGGAPVAGPAFDAELAALGLELAAPVEAEILRCLAAAGPMLRDVLRATLERSPKEKLLPHVDRLIGQGYVQQSGKSLDLAPAWRGRFGEFARLPGSANPGPTPAPAWGAALTALTVHSACAPARLGDDLCKALGWATGGDESRALNAAAARFGGETQTLLAWLAPKLSATPLRALVEYGSDRVTAAARAALADTPTRAEALEASLFVCLSDFADVLTPAVLDAPGERREELLRRWFWFLGLPVPQETPTHSLTRLVSLDYRRICASLEAAAIDEEVQAVQRRLLDEERARRKSAADAYASGRRE